MINVEQLRIGNFIISKPLNKIIEVTGISNQNYIEYEDRGNRLKVSAKDVFPIDLKDDIIKQLVNAEIIFADHGRKDVFFFPGKTTTYGLVYDSEKEEYYIGLSANDGNKEYMRLTRTFFEYHKLQNAYYVVYDTEIKKIV